MVEDLRDAEQAIRVLQQHADGLGQRFASGTLAERCLFLVTEMGELVREVLILTGSKRLSSEVDVEVERDQARERLGLEIYDAVWNLCDLANRANIDLGTALRTKVEINRKRTW